MIGSAEAALSGEDNCLAPVFHPKRLSLGAFVRSILRPSFLTKAAPLLASRCWTSLQWSDSVLGARAGLAGGSGVACPCRVS